MITMTQLELRFPDFETALEVARLISGNPDVVELPPDGEIDGVRFDIAIVNGTGVVYPPAAALAEGEADDGPPPEPLPGFHVIGLWRDPPETVPTELREYMLPAGTLGVTF